MTLTLGKHDRIASMWQSGLVLDDIAIAGLRGGWTRAEAEQVAADCGYKIDRYGRSHPPRLSHPAAEQAAAVAPASPVASPGASPGKGRRPRVSSAQPLTVTEIAEDLRVSKMTVYRMVRRGELGSVKVGRSLRVPVAAYADYLKALSAGDAA